MYCEKSKMRKHLFPTQEKAEQYMRNLIMNARTLEGSHPERVYYCKSCGGWHMTSKAHILQQHIDDGSAVLDRKPIVIETLPNRWAKHEAMLTCLRNYYKNWEKKCETCKKYLDERNMEKAKETIDFLIYKRVHKPTAWYERRYHTDMKERLIKKTLVLHNRFRNILEGKIHRK